MNPFFRRQITASIGLSWQIQTQQLFKQRHWCFCTINNQHIDFTLLFNPNWCLVETKENVLIIHLCVKWNFLKVYNHTETSELSFISAFPGLPEVTGSRMCSMDFQKHLKITACAENLSSLKLRSRRESDSARMSLTGGNKRSFWFRVIGFLKSYSFGW